MAVTTRFCKQTLRRRPPHNKTINDNNWARMVDRNNSVSIEDDEEEEKKHYDKKKRRRGNQINPDSVKIADITRSIPRTHTPDAKKAAPKRDIFQFHCEGDIAGEDDVSSKHVEWKATFDKPIEQLIYPSLQRVNNEGYEERRRAYISLHGSHSSSMVSQQANQSSGSAFGDNIKIDLLPDTEQSVDNKIMFLHTPKWTINISPSRNIPGSRMGAFSPSRSLLESVDTEGEKFLRQKIKEKHHEHLEQQRKERKELELLSSPFHSLSYEKRKAKFGQNISMSQDSGEYVYNNLVSRTLKSRDGKNKIEKLTELTPTEVAYQEHSKVVRETVPSEHQHTQSGLLYFRVRNQLNTARLQEIEAMNHRNMTYSHRKMMRKSSNTFSLRVSALRDSPRNSTVGLHEGENKKLATLTQKIDEMHATRNEDRVMVTAQDLHDLPDLQELNLGRLNRAVNNKLAGFDLLILPPKSAAGKPNAEKSLLSSVEGAYHSPAVRKDAAFRAEINKREAQDRLLLHQLDAGLLPETFIKSQSDAEALTVNLSKYGIGDDRGLCLGKCLIGLERLESLGLSDNRLTAISLPTIIRNANHTSLLHLDLSFNHMHDQGSKAIAQHFRNTGNVLQYLDLCNCGLESSDVHVICTNLKVYSNQLEVLLLASNKIDGMGAAELCSYLCSPLCRLMVLDLSWNNIGDNGAMEFAAAMNNQNNSLIKLNLAANAINDHGGQRFMDSIAFHSTIQEINLSQNNISNRTCFVVSQVLRNHQSMQKLDLSLNPLGEAGARSIFRTILRGLRCFVTMRNCSYGDDATIYKHSYPSHDNPYHLDLSEPYHRAIVLELLFKFQDDPSHCSFENMTYREMPKAPETPIQLVVLDGKETPSSSGGPMGRSRRGSLVNRVCLRGSQEPWMVPRVGILKFQFVQAVFVPSVENKIDEVALNILQLIVENGVTANDKKMWLFLICQDLYFTTEQAQGMIDRFKKKRVIGSGELTTLDLLKSLWKYLLDTENMFDFLISNAEPDQRRDLIYALTIKRYRFNWTNPTGHWTLSLGDKTQRSIMMQLIAINNSESEFSRNEAGRADTSQLGNWYNFRNGTYTADGMTQEVAIDKDFIKNLPAGGTVDFDYVSTTRPKPIAAKDDPDDGGELSDDPEEDDEAESGEVGDARIDKSTSRMDGEGEAVEGEDGQVLQSSKPFTSSSSPARKTKISGNRRRQHTMMKKRPRGPLAITDDEFYTFLKKLGLSNRSKLASANAVFVLMDLQLASTKYYFTTAQINLLLDSFQDKWDIQSKVVITMFSRIKDLHNIDIVLRNLHSHAQQDIIRRIGCLNLINPLKPAFDYIFPLKYLDNRIMVVTLMELASIESADQIQEDPNTELPIATLYGSYTRAVNEVRPEVMKFSFADFGVRTNNISWPTRRDLVKKFLVGSQPVDEDMFKIITLFKEMENANGLSRGPIDLQYATFQKTLKGTQGRTTKTTKSLVNAMRTISNTRKSM